MAMVLVLLASVLFGTTGTARALGLADVDPLTTGALRLAIGGLLLGAIALVRAAIRRSRRATPIVRSGGRARSAVLMLIGALGVVAYQPAFFAGVEENGVAVGTLVALGSAPVFTGVGGWLLTRRMPTARWFACTAIALVGVALLSGIAEGGTKASLPGLLGSLGAGASYALYTLAVKGLLDAGWNTASSVGGVFGVAGIVGVLELVLLGGSPVTGPASLGAALWLGVGTITVAYLLFARGLERLSAPTVSTITLAEPVVAAVLGVLVLDEQVSAPAIAGAVLLVAALALLGVPGRRARTRTAPEAELV